MRQLRSYLDPALATGPQRPLLVQRLRPLLQDERHQPATHQAKETNCKYNNLDRFFIKYIKTGSLFLIFKSSGLNWHYFEKR